MVHVRRFALPLLLLALALVPTHAALANQPGVPGFTDGATAPFPLNFNLGFAWGCGSYGYTGLQLNQNGTFNTQDGGTGSYTLDRTNGILTLNFSTGCLPVYTLNHISGGHLEGTMVCNTGSGCSTADYTGHGAPVGVITTGQGSSSSSPE